MNLWNWFRKVGGVPPSKPNIHRRLAEMKLRRSTKAERAARHRTWQIEELEKMAVWVQKQNFKDATGTVPAPGVTNLIQKLKVVAGVMKGEKVK